MVAGSLVEVFGSLVEPVGGARAEPTRRSNRRRVVARSLALGQGTLFSRPCLRGPTGFGRAASCDRRNAPSSRPRVGFRPRLVRRELMELAPFYCLSVSPMLLARLRLTGFENTLGTALGFANDLRSVPPDREATIPFYELRLLLLCSILSSSRVSSRIRRRFRCRSGRSRRCTRGRRPPPRRCARAALSRRPPRSAR